MQTIALREQDTNWRYLQASDHCDIDASILLHVRIPFEGKPEAVSLFDYWSNIAQGLEEEHLGRQFLGAVIERVRKFLALWLTGYSQEPNREPAIPDDCFEFDLSKIVYDVEKWIIYNCMLIWVCQQALRKEVLRR